MSLVYYIMLVYNFGTLQQTYVTSYINPLLTLMKSFPHEGSSRNPTYESESLLIKVDFRPF